MYHRPSHIYQEPSTMSLFERTKSCSSEMNNSLEVNQTSNNIGWSFSIVPWPNMILIPGNSCKFAAILWWEHGWLNILTKLLPVPTSL